MTATIHTPDIAAAVKELDALISELPAKRRVFANDLIHGKYGFHARGKLSPKQAEWVFTLLDIALTGEDPKRSGLVVQNVEGLFAFFYDAREHLKYPKLTLQLDGKTYKFNLAGSKSKYAGCIQITDGKPFGDNKWYGRISPDGNWTRPKMDEKEETAILYILGELASSPEQVAATYGKLTGSCCFCNKELSDPKSLEVGYGKQCAGHYGLHWGA